MTVIDQLLQILNNQSAAVVFSVVIDLIGVFIIYIVRDKDNKIQQFENNKLDIYKAIKSNIQEKIKQSLCEIALNIHKRILERTDEVLIDSEGSDDEIFDEIMMIVSRSHSWIEIQRELENIENLFKELIKIEKNWEKFYQTGKYVKIAGYLFVITLFAVPIYLILNIYLSFLSVFVLFGFIYLWNDLDKIQTEFLVAERKFYV